MDNLILVSAQGSQYNLGTWLDPALGADYGEQGVLSAMYADNPAADRIQLGFVDVHPRTMKFPLILASSGAFGGLHWLQTQIRQAVNSNPAYLDVLLDGVATGNQIRFDILTGRLVSNHDLFMQSQLRRDRFTLELDTQPFGYMPTWITLASVPTAYGPSSIVVPGASVIGDVKSPARLTFFANAQANTATAFTPGSWAPDVLAWGFNTGASFSAFYPPGSWLNLGGSVIADPFAPASAAFQDFGLGASNGVWANAGALNLYDVTTPVLAQSYIGRFHAFAFMRHIASGAPIQVLLDVTGGGGVPAMASGNQVATLAPEQASGGVGWNGLTVPASPAYQLLDLGEISIPRAGSWLPASGIFPALRLWYAGASWAGTATPVRLGGVYLLPLDQGGANLGGGIFPRGIAWPTSPRHQLLGGARVDAANQSVVHTTQTGAFPMIESPYYRGQMPYVDRTVRSFEWFSAERLSVGTGATSATGPSNVYFQRSISHFVSVEYQPRFLFVKGGV